MTLKEQKIAIEQNITTVVKENIKQDVEVTTTYDANEGLVVVNLKEQTKDENNGATTIVYYDIFYNEEDQGLAVKAMQRSIAYDNIGPISVVNLPVIIDQNFVGAMTEIIKAGINSALNPVSETPAE